MGFWPLAKTVPLCQDWEIQIEPGILTAQFIGTSEGWNLSLWQLAKQKFPRHLKRTANFKVLLQ